MLLNKRLDFFLLFFTHHKTQILLNKWWDLFTIFHPIKSLRVTEGRVLLNEVVAQKSKQEKLSLCRKHHLFAENPDPKKSLLV